MNGITIVNTDGKEVEAWIEPDPIKVAALDASINAGRSGELTMQIISRARDFETYLRSN